MTTTKDEEKTKGSTLSLVCPSDGYIRARGTFDNYTYEAFNADHQQVESVSMN